MKALAASLLVATLLLGVSVPAATSADRRLRSVNGEVLSAPAVAPWNAQLDADDGICSATIIDLSHVLTAGACLFTGSRPNPPSALTITAGVVRAGPGDDAGTVADRNALDRVTRALMQNVLVYIIGVLAALIRAPTPRAHPQTEMIAVARLAHDRTWGILALVDKASPQRYT